MWIHEWQRMNDATYNNSANWYIAPFLGHLQPPKTGTKQNQTSRNTHTTYGISVSCQRKGPPNVVDVPRKVAVSVIKDNGGFPSGA